jgi:dynein heavy chain, axonemal
MRDNQFRVWLQKDRPSSFWMTGFFNPQGFLTAVQQEITRSHKNENWALDSVVLHAEATEFTNVESLKSGPKEGVYVHGLFMDGASWSTADSSMVESAPKKLFSTMPVILVTAMTKSARKTITSSGNYGPFGGYDCPVYKYPARTDRYLIFSILLATHQQKPLHWILRGVALLCSTN